jgi:hypothetical protein
MEDTPLVTSHNSGIDKPEQHISPAPIVLAKCKNWVANILDLNWNLPEQAYK